VLLVVGLFAWLATACTPQGEPYATADAVDTVVLTRDEPVAARRLAWSLDTPGSGPMGVGIGVAAVTDGGLPATGVELDVVRDVGPVLFTAGRATTIHGTVSGPCTVGCEGEVVVVVHALPGAVAATAPVSVRLVARVEAALGGADPAGFVAAASLEQAGEPMAVPVVASSTVAGSERLRAGDEDGVTVPLRLRVDPAALESDRAWPLVGRIHVTLPGTASDDPDASGAYGSIVVAGAEHGLEWDTIAADWLAACPRSGPCDLPIRLVLYLAPGWDTETSGEPPELDAAWSVEARLEAFDGRAVPPDAVVLTLAP
jgi:hypothetical protein